MYVWPQSGSLSLGILPSINVRTPRGVIPARLAWRRMMRAQQARDRLRRGGGMTGLGAVPVRSSVIVNGGGPGRFPVCPQIVQYIPPGCSAQTTYDSNGCPMRVPVCPSGPSIPILAPVAGSGPVPAGFPTNQIFVNSDGSQWMYSQSQGQWINVGTPYNVNAQPASTTTTSTTTDGTPAAAPVVVTAPATPVVDTYGSVLAFLTQSSLIPSVPNWAVGLGALLLLKKVSTPSGPQRNSRRRR